MKKKYFNSYYTPKELTEAEKRMKQRTSGPSEAKRKQARKRR